MIVLRNKVYADNSWRLRDVKLLGLAGKRPEEQAQALFNREHFRRSGIGRGLDSAIKPFKKK